MKSEAILKVENLSLSFGGLVAVQDVTFEVHGEEIVGLVGPNGSGKTCILNMINGFYKPQHGKVLFKGRNITGLAPHKVAQLGVARSFQQMELFPSMTVLQNLLVGCHPFVKGNILSAGVYWSFSQKIELRIRQIAEEVLDFMELQAYRRQLAGDLPIGVQKLVGVARALCAQPSMLLLDEPSSGLSRDEKEDLARFLLRIKYERHIPMLWVEHDMTLIKDLADRLIVLDQGKKVADGPPDDVLSLPQVVQIYSGVE